MSRLLKEFSDSVALIGVFLSRKNFEKAENAYERLSSVYSEIRRKNAVDPQIQQNMYNTINHIHTQLYVGKKLAESDRHIIPKISAVCIFIMLALLSFFAILSPSITGNVVFFPTDVEQFVNKTYTSGGMHSLSLLGNPESFKASGFVQGSGTARLYVSKGKDLHLVYDSQRIADNPFSKACLDSCFLSGFNSTNISLVVELKDAVLHISNVSYTAGKPFNHPPRWQGSTNFLVKDRLEIDLTKYFFDEDGQNLIFLATTAEGLKISIFDNAAVFEKEKGASGDVYVTLIATDFIDVARVPISVRIE